MLLIRCSNTSPGSGLVTSDCPRFPELISQFITYRKGVLFARKHRLCSSYPSCHRRCFSLSWFLIIGNKSIDAENVKTKDRRQSKKNDLEKFARRSSNLIGMSSHLRPWIHQWGRGERKMEYIGDLIKTDSLTPGPEPVAVPLLLLPLTGVRLSLLWLLLLEANCFKPAVMYLAAASGCLTTAFRTADAAADDAATATAVCPWLLLLLLPLVRISGRDAKYLKRWED